MYITFLCSLTLICPDIKPFLERRGILKSMVAALLHAGIYSYEAKIDSVVEAELSVKGLICETT